MSCVYISVSALSWFPSDYEIFRRTSWNVAKTPYLRGSPFSWLEISLKPLCLCGNYLLINRTLSCSPSGGTRPCLTIDDTLWGMWLQAFEALGPQVCINIPWCVQQSVSAHWPLDEANWGYRKSRPQRHGPSRFSASHLITYPCEEWHVDLEGLTATGDSRVPWAGLVDKESAGEAGKLRAASSAPLRPESFYLLKCLTTRKFLT